MRIFIYSIHSIDWHRLDEEIFSNKIKIDLEEWLTNNTQIYNYKNKVWDIHRKKIFQKQLLIS